MNAANSTHKPTTVYLVIVAIGFLATSYFGLLQPQQLTDYSGIELGSSPAFNETRGLYGGVHAMLGLLLLVCAFNFIMQRFGLLLCVAILSGYVFGRMFSFSVDGAANTALHVAFAVELVGALIALFLLSRVKTTLPAY